MTSRSFTAAVLALSFAWPLSAQASNDNFRLSNMLEYETTDDQRLYLFRTFSRELGMTLGYKYVVGSDTTGLYGLDISLESNNVYVDTDRSCPDDTELGVDQDGAPLISTCYEDRNSNDYEWDPWRVMDYDHRLSGGKLYPVPGIRVRKGLPLSLEVGTAMYILPFSSQAALQGFGRWAIHEGFDRGSLRAIPDAVLTASVTRLVGSPEFDLTVLDWGMTFGYTFPVGGVAASHIGDFSIFGGFGRSIITAVPDEQLPEQLQCLSGWTGRRANAVEWEQYDSSGCEGRAVFYDPDFRPFKGNFGIRIHNGPFQVAWAMELARLGLPSMSFKMGLLF